MGAPDGVSHPAGWLRAGAVGSPHGLDGSFYVTRPNLGLLRLGVSVKIDEQERRVVRRAGTERRPILRLEGCEDRPSAQALRGQELLVSRADAPELGPDEWWAEDLEGCIVHHAHQPVGTVVRLLALPSCEVLEVARGEGLDMLLVPLVSDAVREVDLDRREIEVDLRFLGDV
jgi:16S rRNA processing protein RimM